MGGKSTRAGDAIDFFKAGEAIGHEPPAKLLEGGEEALLDDSLHAADGGICEDDIAEFIVEIQEFKEGAAAAITGAEAADTAHGGVGDGFALQVTAQASRDAGGDGDGGFAGWAQEADQTLGEDEVKRVGDEVRLDLEVKESKDGGDGFFGVDAGEDQVAGHGGLHGGAGGFLIADFANEDHIGVLAEDAAEECAEGVALVFIDGDLRDIVDLIFDGDRKSVV